MTVSVSLPPSTAARGRLFAARDARDPAYLRQAGLDERDAGSLASCAEWTSTYPIQRVRKGRKRLEAICPMVGPSLSADAMRFMIDHVEDPDDLESLDALLHRAASVFERMEIKGDPILQCLVVVVPNVAGPRLLEATAPERSVKNELLRQGILVGEFFPSCPFATTFNPRLLALRSPVPMYVLRPFIETDWRFICRVPAWQESYRERFGEAPANLRRMGGFWWRLGEKFRWRYEAAVRLVAGVEDDPSKEETL